MTNQPLGEADELLLEQLHLDLKNPRLPESLQDTDEDRILRYMAEEYAPIEVARSIALHGYFLSEPLIVLRREDSQGFDVVEGNRRLVALRILTKPDLAAGLDDEEEWRELAGIAKLPALIPVVKASSRSEVDPVIGFRHIAGIEPWDPYAKARFIAALVDRGGSFDETSGIVGESRPDVIAAYRNKKIVEQAQTDLKIDTARVISRFGVFNRAMNSPALRNHMEVKHTIEPGEKPLKDDKKANVQEMFSWLFGDDANSAVINESRDITELGQAVESSEGIEILRSSRNLDAAYIAAGGLRNRMMRRLSQALGNLRAAAEDIDAYRDDEQVKEQVAQIREAVEALK